MQHLYGAEKCDEREGRTCSPGHPPGQVPPGYLLMKCDAYR